jgi:N-acetylglucosamine repressor
MTPFELKEEQILVGTHGQYTPAIGAALFYVKEFIQSV